MGSLNNVNSGDAANSSCVQQIVDVLKGTVGAGNIPVSLTAISDSVNYALDIQNLDATNQRALRVRDSSGEVKLSVDGGTATVTLNQAAISSGTLNGMQITGAGAAGAGVLGIAGTQLAIGNGSSVSHFDTGAWNSFTPTVTENSTALSATVLFCDYALIGKTVILQSQISITGVGAVAGAGTIKFKGIPAAIAPKRSGNWVTCGTFVYTRLTGTVQVYKGAVVNVNSTALTFVADSTGGNVIDYMGTSPSFIGGSSDTLSLFGTWQIA